MLRATLIAVVAFAGIAAAQAEGRFDPRLLKGPPTGRPNDVLVLGTAHLSQMPKAVPSSALEPLIADLGQWAPQAVGVEALSGAQCDVMRQYPARYRDTVDGYCWDPAPARAATGLAVPAAVEAVDRVLKDWPKDPSPDQRRHLAALFLAAGEPASALVQWLRLPAAERHQGGGLDDALVKWLDNRRADRGEITQLAVPLAVRLGLERIYPIDDHTADATVDDEKAYGDAMTRAWDNRAGAREKARDEVLYANLDTAAGVLAMYRAYNAPDRGRIVFESDFGAALEDRSAQQFGRAYVGYWETRNLRMASNIRDILGTHPGTRMLVIVGASHKPYLDAYLDEMHDVHIVRTSDILR